MKRVIATTKDGARLTPEQLAAAGVEPGEPAVIEIRAYSEEDWIAETEGKVLSTDEFIEHLRRAPGVEQQVPTHEELARSCVHIVWEFIGTHDEYEREY